MKYGCFFFLWIILFCKVNAQETGFPVVGCFAAWRGNPDSISLEYLTQVNFAFALPTADGSLKIQHTEKLQRLVSRCHQQNVKVVLDIGGWDLGEGGGNDLIFETLASNKVIRHRFIKSVLAEMDTYDLDGINIDWEYPDAKEVFVVFMQEVYNAVHHKNKTVSISVAGKGVHANGIADEVFAFIDYLNIMAYNAGTPHSTYDYAASCLEYWLKRGCPPPKMVLGIPFYGKNPSTHYKVLLEEDSTAYAKDQIGTVYYNGMATVQKKTRLAKEKAGGVMIWELSMDTNNRYSLLKAIHDAL